MYLRLLMVILIISISGCSRIKITYQQLDWLIPYYVDSYISLTTQQNQYLDSQLQSVLQWHCNGQLEEYAKLLRLTEQRLQSGAMTREQFVQFADQFKQYWQLIMRQLNPAVVTILLQADQQQLKGLFSQLDEDNREWYEDYRQLSQSELDDDYFETMHEMLEFWIGSVNERQAIEIQSWVKEFKPLGETGYIMRRIWQLRLQELTRNREDKKAFKAGIEQLFIHPRQIRTKDYQKLLDHNQKVTIDLMVIISRSMNDDQKQFLHDKVHLIASDFEDLACHERIPNTNTLSTY